MELLSVVTHLVCRSEKKAKKRRDGREHWRLPRLSRPRAGGHQDKANCEAKRGEGLRVRQYRKSDDRCESGGQTDAYHETHGRRVSLVGPRCDRMTPIAVKTMALEPFGHAVTIQKSSTAPTATNARLALTRAGSQSGTQGKTPRCRGTGRAEPPTSSASPLSAWDACQHFGRLIGKQPQRRCACW
jgi:hypothetical protein